MLICGLQQSEAMLLLEPNQWDRTLWLMAGGFHLGPALTRACDTKTQDCPHDIQT